MCLADYIQSEVNLISCCISANYNKYYNDNYNYNYNYNYNQKTTLKITLKSLIYVLRKYHQEAGSKWYLV